MGLSSSDNGQNLIVEVKFLLLVISSGRACDVIIMANKTSKDVCQEAPGKFLALTEKYKGEEFLTELPPSGLSTMFRPLFIDSSVTCSQKHDIFFLCTFISYHRVSSMKTIRLK